MSERQTTSDQQTIAALRDELGGLATEAVSERTRDLDMLSVEQLVAAMTAADAEVPAAVERESAAIVVAATGIAERLARGGRLLYFGAGTAGRLGVLDASEIPPTFGAPPELVVGVIAGGDTALRSAVEDAEDDEEAGRGAVRDLQVGPDDAVVGISASGRTPYVLGVVAEARAAGAFTVGLACNAASPLAAAAEAGIEVVVGPEVLTGSTRLKAGTAQKMVLNMLSTIAMVRLGKVYGNLMVDLRATNAKLRARSERTVMLATGADPGTAAAALDAAGGRMKAAILMSETTLDVDAAVALLAAHGGRLREAVAAAHAGEAMTQAGAVRAG
ncbi:N-acetylmuramic acid 6-phosphate etherase [Leifsonia sp. F6_8S_P_1B]|uniref:N-acetylmuramic acid 6-phosphate etherase n=1 Tax=Leifsonia williamsii TaxID=3035919 RepID=A0ABT8KA79_9MICO|nr:N-acetylmuramic acid 6-phosphate etherase [Leifsonia williamsii]MDN4613711.1 N-acetylmuramic acid 6-phosphate etherase [Leifsonia williamsii]